ncbi:LuxR C-terminal-related transcriptional regulator [Kitasatospora sp. NPDC087271]|uniref:LuxR C-terminal-related transcriptional regulator n=1 Tax=Kitasatospora sp. NPDC087271 TaxID=3364067 RepID=UPI003801995D
MDSLLRERTRPGLRPVQLTLTELASYRRIVNDGPMRPEELSSGEGRAASASTVERLVKAGLVRRLEAGRLAAVDPAHVSDRLLEGWEERLQGAQSDLMVAREQLAELGLIYAARQSGFQGPQFERIESADKALRTVERYAGESRHEVLVALPGGPRPAAELPGSRNWEGELLHRGVRLRTLYQHAARFHPPTVAYAEEVAGLGAEVRTVTGSLARFLVFDRKAFLVPLREVPGGALIVRNEDLVALAVEMFNRFWTAGEPIGKPREKAFIQGLTDQTQRSILQHLVDGADDRATARALGISVRTCQRHVSEIMRELGATSRLQLGYLLRKNSLLESGDEG